MAEMAPPPESTNMNGHRRPHTRRLVLFPCPFQGHLNPMFQLAAILKSRGFAITIVHTQYNSPDPTKYPDFRFVPIPDGLSEEVLSSGDFMTLLLVLNANVEAPLRDRLTELMSEEPVACLISDAIMHSAKAAEQVGLPRIVLRTGSAACFNVFMAFTMLREKGYLPIQDPRSEAAVVELPPFRVRDLPDFSKSRPEDTRKVIDNAVEGIKTAKALVWNTLDALEGAEAEKLRQELHLPVYPIGPIHKFSPNTYESLLTQDRTCIEWLDKQRPRSVLYISFGSLACMEREELVEIAWGLANSRQPFLWVLRPGSVRGGGKVVVLPKEFEEETAGRGRVVQWVPQQEVLAHPAVGGFWTHCGWNSTLESICEGVPFLCWPCFGDQMVNSRYLTYVWEVGIGLDGGLERGEIESAVRRLMVEEEGKEMRKRAMELKEKAEACMKEGGSTQESLNRLVDFLKSI